MMHIGADYYPEHWDEDRWPEDARLMSEAGFNVARLAEFAWCRLESAPGVFHFDWLDRAIEILGARDIKVVLGTPTAAPPKWLMDAHPEITTVNEDHLPRGFGTRHHRCVNVPALHTASRRLVEAMADHYANNENLIGYQIDNEFGCHSDTKCYCEWCLREWKSWLEMRHGSAEELNKKWGLIFWSQEIRNFDEVWLPARGQTGEVNHQSPSALLDYTRFVAEGFTRFAKMQSDIIAKKSPGKFITHNHMGTGRPVDVYKLDEAFTHVSLDSYPGFMNTIEPDYIGASMGLDYTRAIARGPFWVMEQQSGPTGWAMMSPLPRPDQIEMWSWRAVARGADGIVYFRWRPCLYGAEQYWHGILGHDGLPNRRYREIARFATRLKALEPVIQETRIRPKVAIIDDYASDRALEFQPGAPGVSRTAVVADIYRALAENGVTTDFVPLCDPLDGYELIFAPLLFVTEDETSDKLQHFVEGGGTLVLTFRSGVKDEFNVVRNDTLPGPLRKISGLVVEEYDPIGQQELTVRTTEGSTYAGSGWADLIRLEGAEATAHYDSHFYAGGPAVTMNKAGKGCCYYVGAMLDGAFWRDFARRLAAAAGEKTLALPEGVEVVRRSSEERSLIFVMNHNNCDVSAPLESRGTELISGESIDETVHLKPYGFAIIEEAL